MKQKNYNPAINLKISTGSNSNIKDKVSILLTDRDLVFLVSILEIYDWLTPRYKPNSFWVNFLLNRALDRKSVV